MRRAALVWLLLALLLVPLLGRLHQITHGDTLDHLRSGQPVAASAAPAHHHPSLFDQLAGHHSAADCLLLDQLAGGDAPHQSPTVSPALMHAQVPPAPPTDRVGVLHVTLFQARGPPQG